VIEGIERGEVAQGVPSFLLHVHGGANFLEVANDLDDVVNHNHQTDDGLQDNLRIDKGKLFVSNHASTLNAPKPTSNGRLFHSCSVSLK